MIMRKLELKGKKYGRLTVIKECETKIRKKYDKNIYWICKCTCGKETIVPATKLVSGHTKSCGCYQREKAALCNSTHKETKTRLYIIWQGIKRRCTNLNSNNYKNYGLKGISICEEWKENYLAFKHWAKKNGYSDSLTIDRIDSKGNYEPRNCRWVSQKVQQNNRSNNRYIIYNGQCHTLSEWSDITGISKSVIDSRLNKLHWSEEKTLSTPLRRKK